MNERLKKPLLFAVIVIVGSVFVLFDIPLLLLVPLIIMVGFATLLALGSISVAEIRAAIAGLGQSGVLKRLNEMKFFEKKAGEPKKAASPPLPPPAKTMPGKAAPKQPEEKSGLGSHISSFVSSIASLGSVIRQRSGQGKKVEDINKLLDKTVSEKVTAPPPKTAAQQGPAGGGGGAIPATAAAAEDPFMSLSGDEFDAGLLDGLGDEGSAPAPVPAEETGSSEPLSIPDMTGEGGDLPAPDLDIDAAAGDILKQAGASETEGASDEFAGLDAGGLSDEDFGDLEGLSLEGVDADPGEEPGTAPEASSPAPEAPAAPAAAPVPAADSGAVKTAWIPSDAPKEAGGEAPDEVSTQADMAAFASGSGGDEDLLSSLAADVKHTKKEQDISLLRELKDFKAPATEIEQELTGMFDRMKLAQQTKRKDRPATKEIK